MIRFKKDCVRCEKYKRLKSSTFCSRCKSKLKTIKVCDSWRREGLKRRVVK